MDNLNYIIKKTVGKIYFQIAFFVFLSTISNSANLYWIGGSGNWSDINNWSGSSGGVSCLCTPTQNDDVFFDVNSGFTALSKVVTLNSTGANCRNMTWSGTLNNPVFTGSNSFPFNIYGSVLLQAGMSYSIGITNFVSNTLGQTITTNNVQINGFIYFNNLNGGWILQDNLTLTGYLYFDNGSLNTNNQTLSARVFGESTSAVSTRTLTLGSSQMFFSETSAFVPAYNYLGNVLNAGTSHIFLTGNFQQKIRSGLGSFSARGGHNYYDITFTNFSSKYADFLQGANSGLVTVRNLTYLGSGTIYGNNVINSLTLSPNQRYAFQVSRTQTITSVFTATSTSCSGLIDICSTQPNSQASFVFNTGSSANVNSAIIRDIAISGSLGSITANNSFNIANNTNIVFTSPAAKNLYWVGGSGNWNDGSNWSLGPPSYVVANCIPNPNDNVFFDAGAGFSAGNNQVTISDANQYCNNMTWVSAPSSPILSGATDNFLNIFGSATLQNSMTYSVVNTWFKSSLPTRSITSNGVIFNGNIHFCGSGGWVFQDAINCSQDINFNLGNLNTNSQRVDAYAFRPYTFQQTGFAVGTRTLTLGASSIFIDNIWDYDGNSLSSGTSTISIIATTIFAPVFRHASGHIYYDIVSTNSLAPALGIRTLSGAGLLTVRNLTLLSSADVYSQCTISNLLLAPSLKYAFKELQHNILSSLTFTTSGCAALGDISSLLPGSQATFSLAPSVTSVNISNCVMKDVRAIGSFTPLTASNSVNLGNNSNINFTSLSGTTLFWIGGAGNWNDGSHWSYSSNGASAFCVPTPNDDVVFDGGSGFSVSNNTVTLNGTNHFCRNMTWQTTITNNPIIIGMLANPLSIFGSLELQSNMNFRVVSVNFKSPNLGQIIRTNGNNLDPSNFYFNGLGGWTFVDNFNAPNTMMYFLEGSMFVNNITLNILGLFSQTNTYALPATASRTLSLGTSTVNIVGYAWSYIGANSTLIPSSGSRINIQQIAFGGTAYFYVEPGHSYNDINHTNALQTFSLVPRIGGGTISINKLTLLGNGVINGAHIINTLILSASKTYQLESARTQTITGQLFASGNPCNRVFLLATTAASRASLNVMAGNVNYDYISVKDIDVSSSYTALNAAGNSVDAGNNLNWNFAPTNSVVTVVGLGPDITRCQNQLPITLNTTNFYPNPFTQFTWSNASTSSTLSINAGGTYSVSVNYGAACTVTDNIVITANPTPTISITGSAVTCGGIPTILTANGASTYTWTSPTVNTNTIQVNPATNTTYSVLGTSAANCVSSQTVITVTVNSIPTIGLTSISANTVCAGTPVTITPNGASTYTLLPGGLTSSTNFVVNPTSTTVYTINGTSSQGCLSTSATNLTRTVTVNSTPTIGLSSISANTVCAGTPVTITPSGASTYTLLPGGLTSSTNFVVNPTSTTVYTISGTSSLGCLSTSATRLTRTVTVNSTPTIGLSSISANTVCAGTPVTITPSGASTYTLLPGGLTSSTNFVVNPTSTTVYTINGTSSLGCLSTSVTNLIRTVTVNSTPTIGLSSISANTVCAGTPVTITPNGASTYTLLPGGLTSSTNFVVNPTSTTVYTISGTSSLGCLSTSATRLTRTVTVNSTPTIGLSSISANTVCVGTPVTITPNGASSYTLLPGGLTSSTNFVVNPTSTTVYTISGASSFGCLSTSATNLTTTLNVNPSLVITLSSITSNTICNGTTVTLTPAGGLTYTLEPGSLTSSSNFTLSPSITTNYTISGTGVGGCVSTSSTNLEVLITVNTTPTVTLGSISSNTICSGNTVTITPNGASTYTLQPGNLTSSVDFVVSPIVTTEYTVSGTSSLGCLSTPANNLITTVNVNTTPTVVLGSISSNTICSGSTVTITPSGASTYTLLPDNAVGTTFTVVPLSTTIYTINGESADACISTSSSNFTTTIMVNVTPTISIGSISSTSICLGNSSVLVPTGANTYTLYPDNTVGTTFTLSPISTTIYTVSGTSNGGCISTPLSDLTTTLSVNSTPTISLGSISSNTICSGSSAVLTPLGAINYSLFPGNETGTSFTVSPTVSSTYTITGIDNNGCVSSNTDNLLSTITVSSLSITLSGQQDVLCYGASTGSISAQVIGGIPTYNYVWSNGVVSPNLSNVQSGVYTLTVTDNVNCISTQTVLISEPTSSINIDSEDIISSCPNKSNGGISISVSGGTPSYSVIWNTGATGLNITNIPSGIYSATVTDSNGCELVNSITVTPLSITDILCEDLFIPEIFSPNGDGQNEKFEIKKVGAYPNNTISIFNRWGSLVYKKDKYNNEWDGKANIGENLGVHLLPAGTYYVVFDFGDGETKPYTGFVQLEY